jgi:hypothetical protein
MIADDVKTSHSYDLLSLLTYGSDILEVDERGELIPINLNIGSLRTGDYIQIRQDGTVRLFGDATTVDDLRVPVTSTRVSGSKDPDFAVFSTDGAGSQGVFAYWFDKSLEEELYFIVQLPHAWSQGSNIKPHVHWTPKTDGAEGAFVRWGLEYTWANVGGTFGNTSIVYADVSSAETATHAEDSVVLANKHYVTSLPSLDGTGKLLSGIINCRVFRDTANDTYSDDAGLLEIDFHYTINSFGSDEAFTKEEILS